MYLYQKIHLGFNDSCADYGQYGYACAHLSFVDFSVIWMRIYKYAQYQFTAILLISKISTMLEHHVLFERPF